MERDSNDITPCTLADWQGFFIDLLDGKYELDIQKIGGSSIFIKNRLGLCEDRNRQQVNLSEAMRSILIGSSFDIPTVLDEPEKYQRLLHWVGDFLGYDVLIMKKLLHLFIKLNTSIPSISEEVTMLCDTCALILFKVLKMCKLPYLGNYEHTYLLLCDSKELERILVSWLSDEREGNILYGCLSIIYLQKWTGLSQAVRSGVIERIAEDSHLIDDVFMDILADMTHTEAGEKIDYIYFLDDVRNVSSTLYQYIEQDAPHWINSTTSLNLADVKEQLKERYEAIIAEPTKIEAVLTHLKLTTYNQPDGIN